jgi:2-amino-4-deoxychorismate synthase
MNGALMLKKVLETPSCPFAILHRPEASGADTIEILFGDISVVDKLADIPLPDQAGQPATTQHQALVLVPHQQIVERGFAATRDGSPLIVMQLTMQALLTKKDALALLPDDFISLTNEGFDIKDDAYADIVRTVLQDEIGTGAGSNFVIKRSFVADITNYSVRSELSLFRRLLTREGGAYWTFIVHTGTRTFVGATPERHVSLRDGVAMMNPISGTYRYPPTGPAVNEILDFLADGKETDELYMVLDEELKMMAQICDGGGQVVGPYLREMARLAHTEYYIKGQCDLDPRVVLKNTMFAPTVIGSPLENACRVVARYEPGGRGYYGGVAALISRDAKGQTVMDSAILIRTADISCPPGDACAKVSIGVGATLVRHSEAEAEVAETHTKAGGVLGALRANGGLRAPSSHSSLAAGRLPNIKHALQKRNASISHFWLSDTTERVQAQPHLRGRRALVIDAEDTFTAMLAHQLCALGFQVEVSRFDSTYSLTNHDVVVLGPGPGDPRDADDPRLAHMSLVIDHLLSTGTPFMAVCLSHQLLSRRLGLKLVRREVPNQGTQREINFFGSRKKVGFYNSFISLSQHNHFYVPGTGRVRVSRDVSSGEVYALRGPHFSSVQFHIESILTQEGIEIFSELLTPLVSMHEELVA